MEPVSGFCDLCILQSSSSKDSLLETCKKLISLGYKSIAINYTYEDNATPETKKKNKKGVTRDQTDVIPPLISLESLSDLKQQLRIYHRLTITFAEPTIAVRLNQSVNIRKYNIIAVLPTTQNAFQYACSTFEADLITFDSTSKNVLKINRKLYNQAINRGLFFELMYTPAICDSTHRKNIIHMSHLYHTYGKSKQIIITSWGSEPLHVRGPYDIINLGLIFGLSEEQARKSITIGCRELLLRAEGRRHGKAVVFVEQTGGSAMEPEPVCDESEDDIMEIDVQPAKKIKQ